MSADENTARPITSAVDPDLGAVRRFIADMLAQGAIMILIASIIGLLVRMRELNRELMRKLTHSRRGKPPSEMMRRLQLELPLLFAVAANDTEIAPKPKKDRKKRDPKNRSSHGRPVLPASLKRMIEEHRVDPSQRTCPACGVEAEKIGVKATEKLDIVPSQFVVTRDEYEVIACQCCHVYVRAAEKRDEVLDRGIIGNELIVQSMVDHYADAVPWERMERNARVEGVPLSANTLASSVGRAIDLLDPIVKKIFHACLSSGYVAFDATSMPVLDREHPLGIRSGTLWLLEGGHQYAYFAYAKSGHAEHLEKLLDGYKLVLTMCDGANTNNVADRNGATRGGCNAHSRRGLVEALRRGDARAIEGLQIFASIFHVDAESLRAKETIEVRFARRLRDSVPLLAALRAWIDARLEDVEPKSALGKAVRYVSRQWKRLTEFVRNPRMELTNNEVERDLRKWVLDRKTWLFCGHDDSARRAADALTIITTCKKFGIEPRKYIRETLKRILDGEKDLSALLPQNYVPTAVARAA